MRYMGKSRRLLFAFACLVLWGCSTALVAKDDRYATPERTWETYKEAIFKGDVEAALDCFADYVKDFQRKKHFDRAVGVKGMQKRVLPIKKIELVRSGTVDQHGLYASREYKDFRIFTEKGPTDWFIFFVLIGEDWKIESLPF